MFLRIVTTPDLKVLRRGARVVEWGGLENRCGGNSTQGSNPCLSASFLNSKQHEETSEFAIVFFPQRTFLQGKIKKEGWKIN